MMLLSELLKTKRYSILFFIILFPIFINILFFTSFYNLTLDEFHELIRPGQDNNPWYYYYNLPLFILALSLPIITSVITFIIKSIEDKANGWKALFTLPKPIIQIHLSKFFVISLYLLLYHAITLAIVIISVYTLSYIKPDFDFYSYPSYFGFLLSLFLNYFFVSIAISSLTYCVIIFIKRSVVSLLLSIFVPIIGMFFTSPFNLYTIANTITSSSKGLRTQYILNHGSSLGFELNVPAGINIYLLGWIVLAWLFIHAQTKRPVINYH
jgi:lantibiotic transport system permease protein